MKILVFHIFAVIESICALYSYYRYVDIYSLGYGRELKFMTVINMWLQLVYFLLCLFHDISKSQGIRRFKDSLYAAIIFPTCLTVFFSFWPIYWYDRELIHPLANDLYIPKLANHFWHTFILVTLFEVFVVGLQYPSRKVGFLLSFIFGLLYLALILWIKFAADFWVYPFMDGFSFVGFVVFLIMQFLFGTMFYLCGEFCNNMTGCYKEDKKKSR